MTPALSFIVPVRNDAVRLERCLRSMLASGRHPDDVEIVVVDNGSTDGSGKVGRSLGAHVIDVTRGRVAELRNIGVRQATAPVLAFIDADHEIAREWVTTALEVLRDPTVHMTGALCVPPPDGTWVQRGYGFLRARPNTARDVDWLGSGNMVVRRDAFERARGFDASLEASEDVDLCHRILAAGGRIVSDPRLLNIHYGDPTTVSALFRGERWRGRDNLRVSFRRPIVWSNLPSAVAPIVDGMLLIAATIGVLVSPWRLIGVAFALGALTLVALGALLRTFRAALGQSDVTAMAFFEGFVVSSVYNVARATSLFITASHRSNQGPVARTA